MGFPHFRVHFTRGSRRDRFSTVGASTSDRIPFGKPVAFHRSRRAPTTSVLLLNSQHTTQIGYTNEQQTSFRPPRSRSTAVAARTSLSCPLATRLTKRLNHDLSTIGFPSSAYCTSICFEDCSQAAARTGFIQRSSLPFFDQLARRYGAAGPGHHQRSGLGRLSHRVPKGCSIRPTRFGFLINKRVDRQQRILVQSLQCPDFSLGLGRRGLARLLGTRCRRLARAAGAGSQG